MGLNCPSEFETQVYVYLPDMSTGLSTTHPLAAESRRWCGG
jgi:hypothetical protein